MTIMAIIAIMTVIQEDGNVDFRTGEKPWWAAKQCAGLSCIFVNFQLAAAFAPAIVAAAAAAAVAVVF